MESWKSKHRAKLEIHVIILFSDEQEAQYFHTSVHNCRAIQIIHQTTFRELCWRKNMALITTY